MTQDETIEIDFDESEHHTLMKMPGAEKFDDLDSDRRCGCGSIAEYRLELDMINNGDQKELDVCPRCLAKYSQTMDRLNIFRGKRGREFPDRYC